MATSLSAVIIISCTISINAQFVIRVEDEGCYLDIGAVDGADNSLNTAKKEINFGIVMVVIEKEQFGILHYIHHKDLMVHHMVIHIIWNVVELKVPLHLNCNLLNIMQKLREMGIV